KVELTSSSADSLISSGSKTTGAGDNLPVTYGFMADTKLTPGTYSTQVTYTAIAETPSYTISSISPTSLQYSDQTNKTITIMTTTPSTELGLGDITAKITDNTNTVNLTNCTEIINNGYRGAQCTYNGNLPIIVNGYNVELTSSWHSATYNKSRVFYIYQSTMQSFTQANCNSLTESTASADHRIMLQDTRDDKVYAVSKLADGNCWMVSNLALDGGRTLHTSDSNVTQDRVLPENISNGTASAYDTAQIYSGAASFTSDTSDSKFGNYYNWNAATATVGLQATTTEPTESVCPKNWRLPSGTQAASKSYSLLVKTYTTIDRNHSGYTLAKSFIEGAPLYITFSHNYYNKYANASYTVAQLITRTPIPSNNNQDYSLWIKYDSSTNYITHIYPLDANIKAVGSTVRCVFGS
ncbi:hypothetical protein IJI55_00725, partial [Candidatus Saccharibacteria bacterium]|nr:hypothetical protein [Candidatus Saccharibacteria bacterium]